MNDLAKELASSAVGEVKNDEETLAKYSRDASLFEVRPKAVVFPRGSEEVSKLVRFVSENKEKDESLSFSVRAGGSCMAGGSLSESIVADVSVHMSGIKSWEKNIATVLPGTFYRDFEVESLKRGLILPCFPASKNLCAIGGMIGNNCAGEKTLKYGKMENFIEKLKVILADGGEYSFESIGEEELEEKKKQNNFEGEVYRKVHELLLKNETLIRDSKPRVSKNSAGYFLWNVWDKEKRTFDLTKLIVGSQGTLGIVTEAELRLVPVKNRSKLFVIFLRSLDSLAEIVNEILPLEPESIESYDDATLKLGIRFFPEMMKTMKAKNFLKMVLSFIPEGLIMMRQGMPKLMLLVEFVEDTDEEINKKMDELEKRIARFKVASRRTRSEEESEKYWTIRRESFSLLRKHVRGRRTAPFVDDVIVEPKYMPEFLPKMRQILDKYNLYYTIAGHAGNGNFHIIPLMDMAEPNAAETILRVSEEVYDLVAQYHGSITAEHNDGIVRTPYLSKMYSSEILGLFSEIKQIFDPKGIFNPGKKVPSAESGQEGSLDYLKSHIVRKT